MLKLYMDPLGTRLGLMRKLVREGSGILIWRKSIYSTKSRKYKKKVMLNILQIYRSVIMDVKKSFKLGQDRIV